MQNQLIRAKKLTKGRARRKDFEKKRNINRHLPSELIEEKVPVYRSVFKEVSMGYPPRIERQQQFNKSGEPVLSKVGTRTITKRVKKLRPRYEFGPMKGKFKPLVEYPVSKKYRLSRKQKLVNVIARTERKHIIKTATNN